MIRYDQQMFGAGVAGDCLVTCLECVLELPQGYLPKPKLAHFRSLVHFENHLRAVRKALGSLNLLLAFVPHETEFQWPGYCVQTRHQSPERMGAFGHAVVAKDGRLWWDPCPESRDKPLGEVSDWLLLVPANPAIPCGKLALEAP